MLSLKESSSGYDEINAKLLKCSLQYTEHILCHVCKVSLTEGIFPESLKTANVIPLFKSDDPMLFNNYRPVSLLCTLSKLFEKVMYNRLLSYLNKNNFFYQKQFGFRKKHSTYMPLIILMDEISRALDSGKFAVGIFLDFSKAFDTVNHKILLAKLAHYGIRDHAHAWLSDYLNNRTQFVSYNNFKSTKRVIKCGVPQGSILGPLLFLIYVDDLARTCKYAKPFLFADDTNLLHCGKNIINMKTEINTDLSTIAEWLKANRLSLNIKKTHFMLFTNKNTTPVLNIQIDNNKINESKQTKFLGVIIDKKINWVAHISYINGKIARGIGIILKARKMLPKKTLTTLYYSFIYPFLI